jgi:hypothetical protein
MILPLLRLDFLMTRLVLLITGLFFFFMMAGITFS